MSDDIGFTPRLGKMRDVGAGSSKRFRSKVLKAARRLPSKGAKSSFTGTRIGRGGAAGLHAQQRSQRLPRMYQRRVVVKVHIARAKSGIGIRAYSRHIDYIQRDGVDRNGEGGLLYGPGEGPTDGQAFTERSQDDRHQFRIIVSPEDANQIGDLRQTTRALMTEMERDLGTRLDWVAVDHHNTGHPHTHIVIRGKDGLGQDLVIARNYLTRGLRARAEERLTQELGPRRDIEIAKSKFREVAQDRFTGLDREIAELAIEGRVELTVPTGTPGRFNHNLHKQRLSHLQQLHLATQSASGAWQLKAGWDRALKAMGRRGDIIRTLAAGVEPGKHLSRVRFFDERPDDAPPILGVVIQHGPEDELKDKRFLLVEDFDGVPWYGPLNEELGGVTPPVGSVVEIAARPPKPRRSDRVIAEIADRSGGIYSDGVHAAADPSASGAYRLAHKRRLEALRCAGIVSRQEDGIWTIGDDYLQKAARYEAGKTGRLSVTVQSWVRIEAQIETHAETWLDRSSAGEKSVGRPGLEDARRRRLVFLGREGLLKDGSDRLSKEVRGLLRLAELRRAGTAENARSGRSHAVLETGDKFEGRYERAINLAQGRMAVVGNEKAFALVAWRPDVERQRGRSLAIEARDRGVNWKIVAGRRRGLSR